MPELPEVETVRRDLAPRLSGATVTEAGAFPSAKFAPAIQTTGATFGEPMRRGKFIIVPTTDDRELILHLGMTGRFSFPDRLDDGDPHLRAWWSLRFADGGDGWLAFHDIRRFGRIRLVSAGDYTSIPTLHASGPEPWDPELTPSRFHRSLKASRRAVKTQLLSQRPVAGVGNIYADEALWAARINPIATRIGPDRAAVLLTEIRRALEQGLANRGTTLRDYRTVEGGRGTNRGALKAYGRAGLPCLRCGEPLASRVVDARTTVYCSVCQRR